ncbi:MAG TPA: site-2 protease family protein [Phycisphaerae bacterium]|nr:site-2 protease family protein [Phycisphaerae bacterium]
MGWQDRGYNTSGGSTSNYFGNPLALLQLSVPFGSWFGVRVRLHFWLLLSFLFIYIDGVRSGDLIWPTMECALTLVALLAHEFGHRFFARRMGGSHDEFMLWPPGGMIPPNAPPFPWPYFVTHVGGILVNAVLAALSAGVIYLMTADRHAIPLNPLTYFFGMARLNHPNAAAWLLDIFFSFGSINLGIIGINLLPYYWFDGGPLLQAILWPFLKLYQAINVTCIIGMVLAVPMIMLSLLTGPMGIIAALFCVLLFASSYTKRQQLKAAGPQEMEGAIAWSASYNDYSDEGRTRRKKIKKSWFNKARKRAKAEQQEQLKIDAILAKVKEKGLHSLTWGEKRTLRKATERQRQRDLANR